MNEQTIERVSKYMAAFNGDPNAWGAYASQAMDVIELAEDQWQPIETAPRDGTEIIIGGDGWSAAGFYSDDEASMRRADSGWFFEDDRANLLIARNVNPTDWQHLPKPPKN